MRSLLLLIPLVLACSPAPGPAGSSGAQPLFVWLHGYGPPNAHRDEWRERMRELATDAGYAFIAPSGHESPNGALFWSAGPACCDRYGQGVDSVARVLAAIQRAHRGGPVFVLGVSNGGFMAHHIACAMPGEIAAAVSFAGAGRCALEIHGTEDLIVPFEGGVIWGIEMAPALPASAAPELWSGPWGHEIPEETLTPMMAFLKEHE